MPTAKRSLLRIVTMELGAPAFLVAPASEMRVLRWGETIQHVALGTGFVGVGGLVATLVNAPVGTRKRLDEARSEA
ncbi:hypothetical protein FF100_31990 [Methylobacterium terricola]|uniref:Uncharacterized protein n=1 Tax=Methylobacterium terricola TaxID=2583531 RepID=A0A5C4L7Q9_9HYPH|nr:hypothetical protein [Methylobacterium terricola]TNC07594.1 hypothetical protein FF100_31990 [Methylobacterium terricola]